MSDREKWEERHAQGSPLLPPSTLLTRWAHLLHGRVLEVAAGSGRNAYFLAQRGLAVHAFDLAFTGLHRLRERAAEQGLAIECVQADLTVYPLPADAYDAVVNIRYLQRSLFEPLRRCLRPGGVVIFETFLIDQRALGHPKNPSFLLERGELRREFAGFTILHESEGLEDAENGKAYLARLVAIKGTGPRGTERSTEVQSR